MSEPDENAKYEQMAHVIFDAYAAFAGNTQRWSDDALSSTTRKKYLIIADNVIDAIEWSSFDVADFRVINAPEDSS